MPRASGVLNGLKVIDLSTIVFGPYCTQMLADMGADVIKVESPDGDFFRQSGKSKESEDMGPIHMTLNRGKRSVVIDLKSAEGKQTLIDLIRSADVFIHNIRGSAIQRLGFDYESVALHAPDIIYVHCVGYGSAGPYADYPAYDDTIQAASGFIDLVASTSNTYEPKFVPTIVADKVSGLYAVQAVLAAQIHKHQTGEGQFVEVPMFESFVHFLLEEHLFERTYEPPVGSIGYRRIVDKDRKPFATSDGFITILPYTDKNWHDLFDLLECPEVLSTVPVEGSLLRVQHVGRFYEAIGERTPGRTTEEWMSALTKINVPAMPVRKIEDILDDPHLTAGEFFKVVEHPTEGSYIQMQPPIRFGATGSPEVGHAPRLGQHTDEVLKELYSLATNADVDAVRG
ncbi:CoA transferase [Arthrobacter sp. StoSoilA2]|uniref:CaiB/BaiF CoA transferase family protein n=1 Tax=Arthrobacter sp. StoSoilA2 TaxID=2830990 RepID=UPI001CC51E02|nr:CoA transferase [Arthrobacter sp. StoSoilA2]BCW35931.1 CoA transferase [Arthrobacter sp. StoSoilA2]